MKKRIIECVMMCVISLSLVGTIAAQVTFAVKYEHHDDVIDTVKVYLTSSKSYADIFNMTASGQITLKVPTGMLPDIQNVISNPATVSLIQLYDNGTWTPNARVDNPSVQPGFDFISFGLTSAGTQDIEYQEGVEIPLFSFAFNGPCDGLIELIDNEKDPFINNGKTSPNNAITVLGARGTAYSGNYDVGLANCNDYDNDGIPNDTDQCPKSEKNAVVNETGCSNL